MIYLAVIDPNVPKFVILGAFIIGLGILLKYFRQPYVIAYILAGVLMGEHGFKFITDQEVITALGEFGLILLLFFIGMEISLPNLLKNWRLATIGTCLQVLSSVLLVGIIGYFLAWDINRIITLGFVISLSSSAVVIKLLQDTGEWKSDIGQDVISILLMQDILIVPMLIVTSYLGGTSPTIGEIVLQLVGGLLVILSIVYILRKKEISLPFSKHFEEDHELQVFAAFIICFGFALATALFGLSAALGAFVGGVLVSSARSTDWLHDSLHSFRVVFVALFFVSIGMLIDLQFLLQHWETVGLLILAVYISNHFINAAVLHTFGESWKYSLYGGALLAQIGELSFVLAASAYHFKIISSFAYQIAIIVISLTLLISPFWITATKKVIGIK